MRTTLTPIRVLTCALLAAIALITSGNCTTAWADEKTDRDLSQRLDRLEQQVHQLADRPAQPDRPPGPMMGQQCYYPMGRHNPVCCFFKMLLVVLAIVHVLLALWVYGDIRKRGEGSGIFIVLALLIGIPGTALYLLARIGDRKP
jgi:hypothetical protein